MDISTVENINKITSFVNDSDNKVKRSGERTVTFDTLLNSAMNLLKETNDTIHSAEETELAYAMGLMSNTAELRVAQQKASISLQYTVAVRNAVLDAYKELMQLQF